MSTSLRKGPLIAKLYKTKISRYEHVQGNPLLYCDVYTTGQVKNILARLSRRLTCGVHIEIGSSDWIISRKYLISHGKHAFLDGDHSDGVQVDLESKCQSTGKILKANFVRD